MNMDIKAKNIQKGHELTIAGQRARVFEINEWGGFVEIDAQLHEYADDTVKLQVGPETPLQLHPEYVKRVDGLRKLVLQHTPT